MSTCAGCVTSFTTFHGTGIQGMWITWGNTATAKTGSVVAADELSVDVELRLYAVNLDTRTYPTNNNAQAINAENDKRWTMDWFIQIMNPNKGPVTANVAGGTAADYTTTLYDAAIGFLKIDTVSGSPAGRDTAVATWATPGLQDSYCLADGVLTASPNCVADTDVLSGGAENLTPVTGPAEDHCVEKWTL